MIIDAHNHPDWRHHDLNAFLRDMDACGIDRTWLLNWESPKDEYDPHAIPVITDPGEGGPIPFSRCLSYVERCPERFILGYSPDPRKPEAIDQLQAMVDIYGVRICGEFKFRMMFDNPDAIRLFHFCGQKGLPVTIHLDYELERQSKYPRTNYWYGGGHDSLERALALCPDTVFLAHAPGFWARISNDDRYLSEAYPKSKVVAGGKVVQMMREYPNLYGDLSGGSGHNALNRDHEFGREFVMEFQDRLLYGRDLFDNRHQEVLNALHLPESVLEKVYFRNALKLVPLED